MKTQLRTRIIGATGAALTAGALVAVSPAPAHAWGLTPPVQVSTSGTQLTVSGNNTGQAAAAWVTGGQVFVSQKQVAGNVWSQPAQVSAPTETASAPDISVGPSGDIALTWVQTPAGGEGEVWLAQQDRGAAWGAARMMSDPTKPGDSGPQVDIGAAGGVTVVWVGNNVAGSIVRTRGATATTATGINQFGQAPAGATLDGMAVARAGNSDAIAAWRVKNADGSFALGANRRSGGTWGTEASLNTAPAVDTPTVTMDGRGNGWVGVSTGAAGAMTPYFWLWETGKPIAGATPIAGAGASGLQLVANYSGQLVASWITGAGLYFSDIQSGVPATSLVIGGPIEAQSLAYSDTGAATVVWARPGTAALGVSHRELGEQWIAQEIPAAVSARPTAVAQAANSLIVYGDAAGGTISSRVLDTRAPTAVHLTAPLRPFNPDNQIAVGWIGSDPSSTVTYEVSRSVTERRGRPGPMELWKSTIGTSAAYRAGQGQTVCFQVRGLDGGGNASGTSIRRCTSTPINDNAFSKAKLKRRTVWKKNKHKSYFRGSYLQAKRPGATLITRNKVKGKRFALLVATSKKSGSIKVKLGRKTLGTYSLKSHSKKWSTGESLLVGKFGKTKKGKLRVIVTSKRKPVRIDGLYVVR